MPNRAALTRAKAHRGGRGNVVENTLPAFAWALINGANTLELDNGITKVRGLLAHVHVPSELVLKRARLLQDGHVIVWHDEDIVPEKCWDTAPAVSCPPLGPRHFAALTQNTCCSSKTTPTSREHATTHPFDMAILGADRPPLATPARSCRS